MDIRDYFSRKRTSSEETNPHSDRAASGDAQCLTHTTADDEEHQQPQKKKQHLSPREKKRIYKAKAFLQKNGKRNMPGSLVRILVMVCFMRHA